MIKLYYERETCYGFYIILKHLFNTTLQLHYSRNIMIINSCTDTCLGDDLKNYESIVSWISNAKHSRVSSVALHLFLCYFFLLTHSQVSLVLSVHMPVVCFLFSLAPLHQTTQPMWIVCETRVNGKSEKVSCKESTWVLMQELHDIYFNVQIFSYIISLLWSG